MTATATAPATARLFTVYARVSGAVVGFTARGGYAEAVAFMQSTGAYRRHGAEAVTAAEATEAHGLRGGGGDDYAAYAPATRAELVADVIAAEDSLAAARRDLSAAEDSAAGTFMGSNEWYSVTEAEELVSDAERELSAARRALSAHDEPGNRAAAEARYATEADTERRAYAARRPSPYAAR